jgi:hypothetical protein
MKEKKCAIIFSLLLVAGCTIASCGCTGKSLPGFHEPVVGTWDGYIARLEGVGPCEITSPVGEEVSRMRLDIYDDGTFEYSMNYSIVNGTLISTGKGNYVVKSGENETIKKYIRYDADKDTLSWENRGITTEFRRSDRIFSHGDLVDYVNRLKAEAPSVTPEVTEAEITPVPTYEVARILSKGFGYDPTAAIIYQMNGNVAIPSGIYDSVTVILRYPDKDEYHLDVGGMGGANFTRKDFKVILNDRVRDEEPEYFIRLDNREYPAVLDSVTENGTVIIAYTTV